MSMKAPVLVLLFFLFFDTTRAQTGGTTTYSFLNVVNPSRVASVGGNLIAVKDNDLSLAMYNPALLNKKMNNAFSSGYVNYFSDINFGFLSYARHFDSLATFSASVNYINYGKFLETDATGKVMSEFTVSDYIFTLGAGREIDTNFSIGANLKMLYSSYWQYFSFGAAIDMGATYHRPDIGFTASALVKNLGYQFTNYKNDKRESLPFEVQVALSQKLKHAPFRFSFAAENLQKWDLSYIDPTIQPQIDPSTGEEIPVEAPGFFDKAARHLVIGSELVTKNFLVGFGFNYRRRVELRYADKPGMIGFSFGAGVRIKKIQLSYALTSYHLAAKSNHFTVSFSLDEMRGF